MAILAERVDAPQIDAELYSRSRRGALFLIQGKLVLNLLWIILVLYVSVPSINLILISALAIVPVADLFFLIPFYYGTKRGPRTTIALTYISMAISALSVTWGLHLQSDFTGDAVIFYFFLLPVAGLVIPRAENPMVDRGIFSVAYLTLVALEASGLATPISGRTPEELQPRLAFAFAVIAGLWIVAGLLGRVIHVVERQRKAESQVYESIRRSTEEEIWRLVGRTIISSLALDQVLSSVLKVIIGKLQVESGSVLLRVDGKNEWSYAKILKGSEEIESSARIRFGTGIVGTVLQTQEPAMVPVARQAAHFDAALDCPTGDGSASLLAVPLSVKGELIGAIVLQSKLGGAFVKSDLSLLDSIAAAVGIAIKNARLFEDEQSRREELSALYGLAQALSEVNDLDAVLDLVTRHSIETTRVPTARIGLVEDGELVIRAARSTEVAESELGMLRRTPLSLQPFCKCSLDQNVALVLHAGSPEMTPAERELLFPPTAQLTCIIPLGGETTLGLLLLSDSTDQAQFPEEKVRVARSIGDQAASAIRRIRRQSEQEQAYLQTVLALSNAVEAKDSYTANHAQRLADMAIALGREIGMDARALHDLRYGAILHDVGKIGVSDAILGKPGKLEAHEWLVIRRHPVTGGDILAPIAPLASAAQIVRHHHERYDGAGYPDGMQGDEIPLGARILSVVDSYLAIRDRKRVYKSAHSQDEAVSELRRNSGSQFDPYVVQVFLQMIEGRYVEV